MGNGSIAGGGGALVGALLQAPQTGSGLPGRHTPRRQLRSPVGVNGGTS